ncbi:hypothetical protein IQ07DRAFT_598916 [Pyrenochaeta sp. DS3sAY3a]|nr:hypothetical protein IQ07DRAFT_598916 [Pyrenochaeta sp. DS3sAY3a]
MSSAFLFFALLQVAHCLSIDLSARSANAHSTKLHSRELATGSKVAIGVCIPAVVLVSGLGFFIMVTYPRQLRKWKRQKEEEEIRLQNKIARGSASHELPPYSERQASVGNPDAEGAPTAPEQHLPRANPEPAPLTAAQTRHAALFS